MFVDKKKIMFITENLYSHKVGVDTLPDIRSRTEPDPKNPNRSSKISERVLN